MVPRREGEEAESAVAADANNASGEAVESFVRPSSNFLYVCILIATVDSKLLVSLEGRSHTQIGCDLLETLLRKLELIEIFRMSIHLRCISKYLENVRCPTWSSRLNSPCREDAKLSGLSYPLSHKEDTDLETRRFVVFFGTRDYMVCMWGRRDFPLLSKLGRLRTSAPQTSPGRLRTS